MKNLFDRLSNKTAFDHLIDRFKADVLKLLDQYSIPEDKYLRTAATFECDGWRARYEAIVTERDELRSKLAMVRNDRDVFEGSCIRLKTENNELRSKLEVVTRERDEARADYLQARLREDNLRYRIDYQAEGFQQLTAKYNSLCAQLDVRNSPYIDMKRWIERSNYDELQAQFDALRTKIADLLP